MQNFVIFRCIGGTVRPDKPACSKDMFIYRYCGVHTTCSECLSHWPAYPNTDKVCSSIKQRFKAKVFE